MNRKEYLENCRKHAKEYFIQVNQNKKIVEKVLVGLFKNKKKYGEFYCPCRVVTGNKKKDKLITCPCVYHMGEIQLKEKCLCELFVKNIKKE